MLQCVRNPRTFLMHVALAKVVNLFVYRLLLANLSFEFIAAYRRFGTFVSHLDSGKIFGLYCSARPGR